jgi:hypothetical protein
MLAVVIVLVVVVVLLAILTAGLLRSHADILNALHQLGVGVGDPSAPSSPTDVPVDFRAAPDRMPLPSGRSSSSAPDLSGHDPSGDPVVVSMATAELTLLAFLSSGCSSCAPLWAALGDRNQRALLPPAVRIVAVTRGTDMESPEVIRGKAPAGLQVVMSTAAWTDYEVPGSPFFALVDGRSGRRIGEGTANRFDQIADLVRQAGAEAADDRLSPPGPHGESGPERETDNDERLAAAGIGPGHPSLYPQSLDDIFESTAPAPDLDRRGPPVG